MGEQGQGPGRGYKIAAGFISAAMVLALFVVIAFFAGVLAGVVVEGYQWVVT